MHSFVICTKPKSYNSKKSQEYERRIVDAFKEHFPSHEPLESDLYGLVYHFFRQDIGIDADNLSKPIWDSLKDVVFTDDKQVKMRVAGSFNLIVNDFTIVDLSGLPLKVATQLLEAFETEEHVLYVECGTFTVDIVRLNLEL